MRIRLEFRRVLFRSIDAVWSQIISTCRGLESVLTVAYLGPQGSFSEQAALEHFGHAVTRLRCDSFDEVFRAVEARSEEHTSELQSLMRNSYAVFCLKKKTTHT